MCKGGGRGTSRLDRRISRIMRYLGLLDDVDVDRDVDGTMDGDKGRCIISWVRNTKVA